MAEAKQTSIDLNDPAVQKILAAMSSGGGTGAISAPQGQENIVIKNDKFDPSQPISDTNQPIISVKSPNAAPKATTTTPIGSADIGYWLVDPTTKTVTNVVPPKTPNADEEMKKALDRMDRQQEMTEKQANDVAGRGYMTNAEYATMASKYAGDKLGQDKLAEDIRQFNATQSESRRQFDLKQAASDKKAADDLLTSAANRGLTGAQAAKTGVETAGLQQGIEKTAAMLPGELKQQAATLGGTEATTAGTQAATQRTLQQIQQGNAPTVQTPQTGMYTWTRNPNTGEVTQTGINPEFMPKTQAEIAARVGQINNYADAKSKEVQNKVGSIVNGKQYTADDALKEFNSWYDSNVAPQTGALQAAQQAAAFQQAKDEAAMRTSAYNSALGAGTQAINAFAGMQNGRVGPGFEAASQAASSGDFKALGNVPNATTYQAPDLTQTANDAVMNALKYISPTAAQATGTPLPNFQSIDITGNLDRLKYMPGGQPQPLPAAAAPVTAGGGGTGTAVVPPAGQTYDWASLFGRLNQDVADQRVQAQVDPFAAAGGSPPPAGMPPGPRFPSGYTYLPPNYTPALT